MKYKHVPPLSCRKWSPERISLSVGFARQRESAGGPTPPKHHLIELNAVSAAWALAEPNPCCGKIVLNWLAWPFNAM